MMMPKKIDLIHNHTRVCGFNCPECCVAAIWATNNKLWSADLKSHQPLVKRDGENRFAAAQRQLQARGEELDFAQKLKVIEHLGDFKVRVDVSGGDALIVPDGKPLLEAYANKLGRDNVTLTITGMKIPENLEEVAACIGEFNFTFNAASPDDAEVRSKGYADLNLRLARKIKATGVSVRAEFPLARSALDLDHIERIYTRLAEEKIDKLLLMRQFPVGRGKLEPEHVPTREEYISAIMKFRELEQTLKGPAIKLQCALRHIEVQEGLAKAPLENPCDLGVESFGLMADGTLLASPWAMNEHGKALNDFWKLGNLAENSLEELLSTDKAQAFMKRSNENFGQCKIFAALNSKRKRVEDRAFDMSDPLYADHDTKIKVAAE